MFIAHRRQTLRFCYRVMQMKVWFCDLSFYLLPYHEISFVSLAIHNPLMCHSFCASCVDLTVLFFLCVT
ncbi:hypothetical protein K503DRAFT_239949 [Rhizopogon vinicolor AM-OR11-026]|uniref:Uncharacterized protein n=1 Tax=Rhizopogon vinicolor AM-OR11-026 TaxID=1314800 RepID=A0A1B7MXL8_9AGAM|nr:hypothetical protein K503DRAFT_239949 [Rhizopogon vinicolor AM-OR11-026]